MRTGPYGALVDTALAQYNAEVPRYRSAYRTRNWWNLSDLQDSTFNQETSDNGGNVSDFSGPVSVRNIYMVDEELGILIWSFNEKQKHLFEYVFHWARSSAKQMTFNNIKDIAPLRLFIPGGCGCGKSHNFSSFVKSAFILWDRSWQAENSVISTNRVGKYKYQWCSLLMERFTFWITKH